MKNEIITIEVLRSEEEMDNQVFYNFRIKDCLRPVGKKARTNFYKARYKNQTGNTSIAYLSIEKVLYQFENDRLQAMKDRLKAVKL